MYKERIRQEAVKKPKVCYAVYEFDSMSKVIGAARRLNNMGETCVSSLYYDEAKGAYYLLMDNVTVRELKFAFLNEYSVALRPSVIPYIKEHYICARKNDAVKILGNI